jgi:hypothetical protein
MLFSHAALHCMFLPFCQSSSFFAHDDLDRHIFPCNQSNLVWQRKQSLDDYNKGSKGAKKFSNLFWHAVIEATTIIFLLLLKPFASLESPQLRSVEIICFWLKHPPFHKLLSIGNNVCSY